MAKTFINRVEQISELGCATLLIAFTGLVLYSVSMRYFFHAPPMWGEDVPKLLFVWMSFIGGGICYLRNQNIRMTSVIESFPTGLRRVIEVCLHLGILCMLLAIMWFSLPVLKLAYPTRVFSTGLSNIWTYLALPLASILFFIHSCMRIARILKGGVDDGSLESNH